LRKKENKGKFIVSYSKLQSAALPHQLSAATATTRDAAGQDTDDEPTDEVKRIITSVPYVFSMHPVV